MDRDSREEYPPDPLLVPLGESYKLKLDEVFSFVDDYWKEMLQRKGQHGLTEELELCDLLDLDAEGEGDDDTTVPRQL